MKKALIILISFCGFLVFLWVVARLTHVIDVYVIPTGSSEPTYHESSIVIASRFKNPANGAFICYRKTGKKDIFIHRCIASGGDLIEMRNGVVYLNGKPLSEPFTWNDYIISSKQLSTIQKYVDEFKYPVQQLNDSVSVITLSSVDLKTYHLNLELNFNPKGVADPEIFPGFNNPQYNADNLGPIRVPQNSYFLLGDNRHNALDSRYMGFVSSNEVLSTVIR